MARSADPLTEARLRILDAAARHKLGLVERPYVIGFARTSWDRNANKLIDLGFLVPYVHGGYEITDAGRAALIPPHSDFDEMEIGPERDRDAPPDVHELYREAFSRYGVLCMWSTREMEHPTLRDVADAAGRLKREGNAETLTLARRIDKALATALSGRPL